MWSMLSSLTHPLTYEHISTTKSVCACVAMGSLYVGSLYLWHHENRYRRNEPDVIKRRFVSVTLSCLLSLGLLHVLGDRTSTSTTTAAESSSYSLADWIGFRLAPTNLLRSSLVSLFLTVVLFFGPIVQYIVMHTADFNNNSRRRTANNTAAASKQLLINPLAATSRIYGELKWRMRDLVFMRNYIISPFTEEFVFRSCMLPLIAPALNSRTATILVTPLFFGVAHLHHIVEGLKTQSASLGHLVAQHLFQFAYTYVFGVYSTYLFVRTGCFAPSFLIHSFCNLIGFPHVDELVNPHSLTSPACRAAIAACYVLGFVLFFRLLAPLTEPHFFDNHLYLKFTSF